MVTSSAYYFAYLALLVAGTCCSPHHTPDHANHCHADGGDSGVIHIEVGESASLPGKCQKVTCEKDFSLSSLTCPEHIPEAGCKLSEIDHSKPYPECCPRDICDKKY